MPRVIRTNVRQQVAPSGETNVLPDYVLNAQGLTIFGSGPVIDDTDFYLTAIGEPYGSVFEYFLVDECNTILKKYTAESAFTNNLNDIQITGINLISDDEFASNSAIPDDPREAFLAYQII